MALLRRPKKKPQATLPKAEPQKFSFDLDTIVYLAALQYSIRAAIEERMVEISANPKCIPIAVAKKVVKEFGLQKYNIVEKE